MKDRHIQEFGSDDEWPVNIDITDPDQLITMRPSKKHAIRFETSPGSWAVIMLSTQELANLIYKLNERWIRKVFDGGKHVDSL